MELRESDRIEFKLEVNERICKTVVAFANTLGGTIYVGIDDFGNPIGVPSEELDGEMLKLSNLIHDLVCPEIMQFVSIEPYDLDGKTLIKIGVDVGDERPYHLSNKGPVPAGTFTRVGPANIPMSRRDIRRMIRLVDGDSYETRQSRIQDLTFHEARRTFDYRGIPFDETRFQALGLYSREGVFSNLALLISDQNPHELKLAIFNDDAETEFLNRLECTGSILKQFDDALQFLTFNNNLRSYFPTAQRIDKYDYPLEAVREGLLNCLLHRDYDEETPTLIKMNRTQLRFISRGDLFDIELEQALMGSSNSRNKKLVQVFHRLGIVEAYGSGLRKIFKLYEREELSPQVEANGFFYLTLPNCNTTRNPHLSLRSNEGPELRGGYDAFRQLDDERALPPDVARAFHPLRGQTEGRLRETERCTPAAQEDAQDREDATSRKCAVAREASSPAKTQNPGTCNDRLDAEWANGNAAERLIIEYTREAGGTLSRQEAERTLSCGRDTALKVLNGMVERGMLTKEGKARATRYHIAEAKRA